jgi:magnesium-transporting ATPase (P-type)
MYQTLLILHSYFRWLVLLSLVCSIIVAWCGWRSHSVFGRGTDMLRHWTATIAHIQLVLGILLYSKSPIIRYFWQHKADAIENLDTTFFALIHLLLMLGAITVITIGSALAKRRATNGEAFRTMFVYYSVSLLLILLAIPWPFSPLAQRPVFR